MREVKFRAWDKRRKQVRDVLSVQYFQTPLPELGAVRMVPEEDTLDDENLNFHSDIELMQYTGLKDKNGKDIYEGDVYRRVLWHEASPSRRPKKDSPNKVVNAVITYDSRRGGFYPATKLEYPYRLSVNGVGLFPGFVEDGEVIGNIYENPELIKDKK